MRSSIAVLLVWWIVANLVSILARVPSRGPCQKSRMSVAIDAARLRPQPVDSIRVLSPRDCVLGAFSRSGT